MNENPIVIKYNNDLAFRKRVAFNRIYHAGNIKKRVAIELALGVACIIAAVAIWFSAASFKYSTYVMYCFIVGAAVAYARVLRAALARRRIKPNDPSRAEREFVFMDDGFMFGPINDEGELMKTRWGDFDRVYLRGDVMYLLCMSRKHWAAIDKKLIVEGEWDDLVALVCKKVPRAKIYGLPLKALVK